MTSKTLDDVIDEVTDPSHAHSHAPKSLHGLVRSFKEIPARIRTKIAAYLCTSPPYLFWLAVHLRNFIQEHSLSTTVSEADEAVIIKIIDDITYLANYIYEEMIPYLQQKLDQIIYHSNIYSSCDQNEPIDMDIDQICHLRRIGLTWVAISTLMGISRTTLYRRRKEAGIIGDIKFTNISDDDLQQKIVEVCLSLPDSGERMVMGALRSCGIVVPRLRLRKALHSIDPISSSL